MYDLLIRNGTLVDGTGADRCVADIAISDGMIVAVGPGLDGEASEIIDAADLLITPGFVDVHSHYDGQATWDEVLEPSSLHGVTTLVMGNCGVGFAPVKPGSEEWLIQLMEGVEDIPGTALYEGIDFTWESFPEYLDALDQRCWSVDVGAQVAHARRLARRVAVHDHRLAPQPRPEEPVAGDLLRQPDRVPGVVERRGGWRCRGERRGDDVCAQKRWK